MRKINLSSILSQLLLLLFVVIWIIPTFGLFISSLRDKDLLAISGWWTSLITTKINEIYAIGPAISMLMEGYIEKNKLTSLRGTLVPATTINKSIAKLPLVGELLVGKKTGEGVFGVSFKIKGPPKNLKTTVNPIKTLTPRFITRTLDKLKKD